MATVISNKALNEKLAKFNLTNVVITKVEVEGGFYFTFTVDGQSDESFKVDVPSFKTLTIVEWAKKIDAIYTTWYVNRKSHEAFEAVKSEKKEEPETSAVAETEVKTETEPETETKEEKDLAPIVKQYQDLKAKHPDALLLFRCGDFYETYFEDAVKASKALGITLTVRNSDKVKMAGFPYHALDTYLPKLVRAGLRVAICDQLSDPRKTTKLVKRGISEIVQASQAKKVEESEKSQEEPVETVKKETVTPEKPKKEKKAKKSDAVTLEDIQKLASRMYQKFNVEMPELISSTELGMILRYKAMSDYWIKFYVKENGEMEISYCTFAAINPNDATVLDFMLRLNFLLQDKNRQNKLSDMVYKSFNQPTA